MHINFGNRLWECRNLAELTQEELGARAGVSYKYIGEIERGVRNPSLEVLHKIAVALSIDITELVYRHDVKEKDCNYRMAINRILLNRDADALYKILKVMQVVFDEKKELARAGR